MVLYHLAIHGCILINIFSDIILQWVKPKKIDFAPRHRKKGRSGAGKREQRRQGVIDERKRLNIKQQQRMKQQQHNATTGRKQHTTSNSSVLDRFKAKI